MADPDIPKIGKYEIQAELGRGGFGKVYRAFDPTVGRPVAIKILTTEGNRDLLTRFRNEATAAGKLKHKNIVTVYEFGEYNDRPFMVMELLEGQDLVQIIKDGTKLSLLKKMKIMDQVAEGLDCAHRNGVIHRDVKPANIRLLPDGTVKIMDFGVARINRERNETGLTQQGDLIGTILYMSPEQFSGSVADVLSDIFAYGLTYYELLTGEHPFRSTDPARVMFKISMEDPKPLRSLVPECPEGLEQIINRALQKDRELRYQGLRDLRLDTEPLLFELQQERAKELIVEAQKLADVGEFQKALSIIHEALDLDPGNRDVRQMREAVQRELQKQALESRVKTMLETAEEQLARRDFASAIQTLELALKLDHSNLRTGAALGDARDELRKFKECARLVSAALQDLRDGDLAAAEEKGSEAERLDPTNSEAQRLLAELREKRSIRERLQSIDTLQTQGNWDAAIDELRTLSSQHSDSREIRRSLDEAISRKASADRIGASAAQAERCIAQSRFQDAIDELSRALAEAPADAALLALLARAGEGLRGLQRTEEIGKAVRAAEALKSAQQFDEALAKIDEALLLFPDQPQLTELRAAVSGEKSAREHELLVKKTVEHCNQLRANGQLAQALEAIQAGLNAYPWEPALVQMESAVRQECKRQQAEEGRRIVEEGRRLLHEGRFQQAVELLERACGDDPEASELQTLLRWATIELAAQKRREAVENVAREAQSWAERKDFKRAVQILEKALETWPHEGRLEGLLQVTIATRVARERERAVEAVLQKCEQLSKNHRLPEALEVLQASLEKFAREPALLRLQRELTERLESQRRTEAVNQIAADAQRLLDQNQTRLALEALEKSCLEYPNAVELRTLLHQTRHRLSAIEEAVTQAKSAADNQNFKQAAEILGQAGRMWPGESQLIELLKTVHEAQAASERQSAIDAVIEQCNLLQANHQFSDALQAAQAGLQKYAGDPALVRLEAEVRQERQRQERAEAVKQSAEQGRRLLEDGRAGQAVELLQLACAHEPEAVELRKLLDRAQEQLKAQRRQAAVEQARSEAQDWVDKNDFKRAIQVLEKALQSWPEETGLIRQLQATKAAQAAKDRADAVGAIVQRCGQLRASNQVAEALDTLQAGLTKYDREPALVGLEKELREELNRRQRKEAASRSAIEVKRLLEEGQTKLALDALEKACLQYPDEGELRTLLAQARQRWDAVQQAVQKQAARADRKDFAGALQVLIEALRSMPRETQLLNLLDMAKSAKAAWERQEEIDAIARDASQLRATRQLVEALERISGGLKKYPQEPALTRLEAEVRNQLDRQQQDEAVRESAEEGQRLLGEGHYEQAVKLLEQVRVRLPDAAELETLLNRAKVELAAQRRRQAVEQIVREAQACAEQHDFKRALQILEKALQSWPGEKQIEEFLRATKEVRAAWERERAIEAVLQECQQATANRRPGKALKIIQSALIKYQQVPALVEKEKELRELIDREQQGRLATSSASASPKAPGTSRNRLVVIGISVVAVLGAAVLVPPLFRVKGVAVSITSNVDGAGVALDGQSCVTPNCSLTLPGGTYELTASKDGFKTLSRTVSFAKGSSEAKIPLVFEPLPQLVQVNTNFASGRVSLDNGPAEELRDGQFALSGVSPGTHILRITAGDAHFETRWRNGVGVSPELQGPIVAKNIQATVIANVGQQGTIACACDPKTVKVDGNAVASAKAGASGVALTDLKEGARRISIGDRSLVVDVKPNPSLNVFLALDREVGTLVIETGEDGARVYIDGRQYHRLTEHGLVRVPLGVGKYTVRVEKGGFRTPSPQTVDLAKSEEKQVTFVLPPVPPALEIVGALPAVRVKLDGHVIGETSSNGSFMSEVAPGNHVVDLSKQDYTDLHFTNAFVSGRTVRLDGSKLTMARLVKPPPPPEPAPVETKPTEAQDWDRVRASSNPDDLEDFIRKHPGGQYLDDARSRLSQLRAQIDAAAARQAEQAAWSSVDKNNKAALLGFLSRYGAGAHAQDARAQIAGIDKQEADAITAARLKEQKPKEPDQPNTAAADFQSIDRTLKAYETAYNAKDLKSIQNIWQAMPRNIAEATRREFGDARGVSFQIRPLERPTINGDSAVMSCTRKLSLTTKGGQVEDMAGERVKVTLSRSGSGWLIQSIVPY